MYNSVHKLIAVDTESYQTNPTREGVSTRKHSSISQSAYTIFSFLELYLDAPINNCFPFQNSFTSGNHDVFKFINEFTKEVHNEFGKLEFVSHTKQYLKFISFA